MTDTTSPPPVKPGYLTTEFWLASAAKVLGILFASGVIGDGSVAARIAGLAATVLAALGYTVSRSIVKAAGVLLLIGLAGSVALQPACGARPRIAAGVGAFLDCESPHVDAQMLADAKVVATSAIGKWISGSGTIDTAGLKADAAPLKSDLMRCAMDAAIAVLTAPVPEQVGAPKSAAMAIDVGQVRATWSSVRSGLGWPARAP